MSVFNLSDLHSLLMYYENLSEKFPNQPFDLVANSVNEPSHMSPWIADVKTAPYLVECIDFLAQRKMRTVNNQQEFIQFLQGLHQQIVQNTSDRFFQERLQFVKWIERYDQIRKTNFGKVFPELSHILEEWKQSTEDLSIGR